MQLCENIWVFNSTKIYLINQQVSTIIISFTCSFNLKRIVQIVLFEIGAVTTLCVVGRVVLCNWSPVCTVKYRPSTLHLTLTLTPCKLMQGGLGFQGTRVPFKPDLWTSFLWCKICSNITISHCYSVHSINLSTINCYYRVFLRCVIL